MVWTELNFNINNGTQMIIYTKRMSAERGLYGSEYAFIIMSMMCACIRIRIRMV